MPLVTPTTAPLPLLLADPFLGRFDACPGLVNRRQKFVRRCQKLSDMSAAIARRDEITTAKATAPRCSSRLFPPGSPTPSTHPNSFEIVPWLPLTSPRDPSGSSDR